MRILRFTLENGMILAVPLKHIADDRAKFYAEKDKATTYQEEFDFVMEDPFEGIDWFQNNMDPQDVEEFIQIIKKADKKSVCDLVNEADELAIVTLEPK